MDILKRIAELSDELDKKESEFSDVLEETVGISVEYEGRLGKILWVDTGNKLAFVAFEDGKEESVDFEELH